MKKAALIVGMVLLPILAFFCALFTADEIFRTELTEQQPVYPNHTRSIKKLIRAVLADMKNDPRETIRKLERLQEKFTGSYEGHPLDDYLSEAGFQEEP